MTATATSAPPPIRTRKPTGLPSYPTMLLAGVEGSGKSVRAVLASASSMVHRTFWIGAGEDDPDEYGIYDGVRFEIVEHDGTYRGIYDAVKAAAGQAPGPNGEPNLLVLDSGSRFWALLHDQAQETANNRARRKAARTQQAFTLPAEGAKIAPDIWNTTRNRWYDVLDVLRYEHRGPVVITSRLKMTTIFENGEPTKAKDWDQKAQYDLPFDVGLYVQMRGSYPARDDWLIRVRSARYEHPVDAQGNPKPHALPADWTIESLWRSLGLGDVAVVQQAHHQTVSSGDFDSEDQRRAALIEEIKALADQAGVALDRIAEDWAASHNGQAIGATTDFGGLELVRDDLRSEQQRHLSGDDDAEQPPAQPPAAATESDADRLRAAAARRQAAGGTDSEGRPAA